jgi:hypothetical protein
METVKEFDKASKGLNLPDRVKPPSPPPKAKGKRKR